MVIHKKYEGMETAYEIMQSLDIVSEIHETKGLAKYCKGLSKRQKESCFHRNKERNSSKYDLLVLKTCLVKGVIPYSWIVDLGVATHVCFLY